MEFVIVTGSKVGLTFAPKGFQKIIIWVFVINKGIGRFIFQCWSREKVNKIDSSFKGLGPKLEWKRSMDQESNACLDNVPMFSLNEPILLMGISARETMHDSKFFAKWTY